MSKNAIAQTFQQIFLSVFFLTLLSGGASLRLASQKEISPQQERVFDIANTMWEVGLGVVFEMSIVASAVRKHDSHPEKSDDL